MVFFIVFGFGVLGSGLMLIMGGVLCVDGFVLLCWENRDTAFLDLSFVLIPNCCAERLRVVKLAEGIVMVWVFLVRWNVDVGYCSMSSEYFSYVRHGKGYW